MSSDPSTERRSDSASDRTPESTSASASARTAADMTEGLSGVDPTAAMPRRLDPPTAFARDCDLVMKGGITSGVVYPLAIVEIAKAFRLRSIGGTSAGAMAAAVAAAAECGRQRQSQLPPDIDPFAELAQLPSFLGAQATSGGTRLLAFFRPLPALRPLFQAFTASLGQAGMIRRVVTALAVLLRHHWWITLLAAIWAVCAVRALPMQVWSIAWAVLIVAGVAGLAASLSVFLTVRTVLRTLPGNFFGVCTGMAEPGQAHADEPLTPWLSDYLDRLSGQSHLTPGRPLTFRDLKAQGIQLEVMTTCLTLGRPFRLPFRNDTLVKENNQFAFDEQEFRRLFPASVVDWMVAKTQPFNDDGERRLLGDIDFGRLRRLPDPDDLPVIVAVRMSLSFPVLLSAIPLHAVDFREVAAWRRDPDARPRPTPRPCWFTDGGVGSNFPIHFFDTPLPTRPTFGLDLGSLNADAPADAPRVVFPRNNGDAMMPYWRHLGGGSGLSQLVNFLGTVFTVAKDWSHESLTHMPGFRDRIGLIRLNAKEGGLNLTMPPALIQTLTDYGREAGREFVIRFGDPAKWPAGATPSPMDWENHQAIRLRLTLAAYSEAAAEMSRSLGQLAETPSDYDRFFTGPYGPPTYRFHGLGKLDIAPDDGLHVSQAGLAHWSLDALLGIAKRVALTTSVRGAGVDPGTRAPKPLPELRLRPRI